MIEEFIGKLVYLLNIYEYFLTNSIDNKSVESVQKDKNLIFLY